MERFWENILLALTTPALTGVVFRDRVLKGPMLSDYPWEFVCENLKNNASTRHKAGVEDSNA